MRTGPPQGAFLALLALLGVLGQFGSNVFLPGLPQIATDFKVSPNAASTSYSVFLAVFGFAQLVAGPLADRFGRRPLALQSSVAFTIGSAACALAPTLGWLLVGRVLQGLGAAGAIVASRTVARDSYSGPELVRAVTLIMMAFALVPGLSPLLGGLVTEWLGWRSTLWVCVVLGAITWLWTRVLLAETRPPGSDASHGVIGAYRAVLGNRLFVQLVLIAGIGFGGLLAFFGAAPRLYMLTLGVSPVEFGLYPPIALLGFFAGAIYLRKNAERRSVRRLLATAMLTQVLGCLVMLVPVLLGWLDKWSISAGIIIFVAGLGLLSPLASATAMNSQQAHAGQASALMGFMQMVAGAAGAAFGNWLCNRYPATGMQWSMLALACVNLMLLRALPADLGRAAGATSRPATSD